MELKGNGEFHLDSFFENLKTNCGEFGIHRYVIDSYTQVVHQYQKKEWLIDEGDHKNAKDI